MHCKPITQDGLEKSPNTTTDHQQNKHWKTQQQDQATPTEEVCNSKRSSRALTQAATLKPTQKLPQMTTPTVQHHYALLLMDSNYSTNTMKWPRCTCCIRQDSRSYLVKQVNSLHPSSMYNHVLFLFTVLTSKLILTLPAFSAMGPQNIGSKCSRTCAAVLFMLQSYKLCSLACFPLVSLSANTCKCP